MSEAVAEIGQPHSNRTTARLVVTFLALVAAVALIGGTAATVSTSTVNPGGTFSAIGPELTIHAGGGSTCLSGADAVICRNLFPKPLLAGEPQSAPMTANDTGSVPISSLRLWSAGCRQGPTPSAFAGTGDLCAATWLTIHDDTHNECYFPTRGPGACSFVPGATLSSFVHLHDSGSPIDLPTAGLASGNDYTFAVELDPGAGNDLQGRWAEYSVSWQAG